MLATKFQKFVVIGLGVVIVFALGLVVYGVMRLDTTPKTQTPVAVDVASLGQPVGTEISQILSVGGSRVAVVLKGGAIPDRIVVVDLGTGKLVSTISTSP
jgi:hypothetical protein